MADSAATGAVSREVDAARAVRFTGRRLARAQALQLLFQAEQGGCTVSELLDSGEYLLSQGPLEDYARDLALGTAEASGELDPVIAGAANNWSLTRMPPADRALLRLAVYEMLCEPTVERAVAIDEAVELAKYFCSDDSPRFVNGVLGGIAARMDAGELGVAAADAADASGAADAAGAAGTADAVDAAETAGEAANAQVEEG